MDVMRYISEDVVFLSSQASALPPNDDATATQERMAHRSGALFAEDWGELRKSASSEKDRSAFKHASPRP